MSLSLSKKSFLIAQSEIRVMTLELNVRESAVSTLRKVSVIQEVPLPDRIGAEEAKREAGINSYTRYDGLKGCGRLLL